MVSMKEGVIIRLRFEGDSKFISKLLQCPNFIPTGRWEAGQKKSPRRQYDFDGVEYQKELKGKGSELPEAGMLIEQFLTSDLLFGYDSGEFKWERSLLSLIYCVKMRPTLYIDKNVIALISCYAVDLDIDFLSF